MELPLALDVCCGSRMFWFDPRDSRALFVDKRAAEFVGDTRGGRKSVVVAPDFVADFTSLPFASDRFHLVVFDPPHSFRHGDGSWMAKKYGVLGQDWRTEIRHGFAECFRVLRPGGTLVFKWAERDVPTSQILALSPHRPLFGNRCGKAAKTHWLVFIKPTAEAV